MTTRLAGLTEIDPPSVSLPHGTEVTLRMERSELDEALSTRWRAQLDSVFATFDAAEQRSALPPEPLATRRRSRSC